MKSRPKKPFPQATWRATCKLQLVHTDVGGPLSTASLNGSRYLSSLLMIIPGFAGFSFLNSNQKLLMCFESIKHGWETKVDAGFKH
jgi:hypothetical protein